MSTFYVIKGFHRLEHRATAACEGDHDHEVKRTIITSF